MRKLALAAVLFLAGCSNYIAGTVNGQQPFVAKSTLFLTWPPTAITFSTGEAETTCTMLRTTRSEPGGGGLLFSGLSGTVGTDTVCPDIEVRAGRCGRTIAFYFGVDGTPERDWRGSVTISAIAANSVRGEFDLQSDSGQIRGQFDAKPCLSP